MRDVTMMVRDGAVLRRDGNWRTSYLYVAVYAEWYARELNTPISP